MEITQPEKVVEFNFPVLRKRTDVILRGATDYAFKTARIPQTLIPVTQLLLSEENVTREALATVLDDIFANFYEHPLTRHSKFLTTYLRRYRLIPNEETTESLIRFVVGEVVVRSPVPVPESLVEEFWTFFHELMSEPELKGLAELNLDISRQVLRSYEPLLIELINLLKETRRQNQLAAGQARDKFNVIQKDLVILRRQIKAIRYIKPFFETDPRDFHTQAEIIARMVREFGPFFIKMAQVAAANADFLPEEISRELKVFQEDVPPMSSTEVLGAFRECYGKSPNECYLEFDIERPLKSGSIGSVYTAKKPVQLNGQEVLRPIVVKVGRHNLEREFMISSMVLDLTLMSSQYWAPHSKLVPFLKSMAGQLEEFVKGFEQELNFESEAKIQQRFAQLSKTTSVWTVPEIYQSNRRILEMEYLTDAVTMTRAFEVFGKANSRRFQQKVASNFIYTVLHHILVVKEFHGDLHPGNIMVNQAGHLFLIDWGNTVQLEGKWIPLFNYLKAVISADVDKLADAVIAVSSEPKANASRRGEVVALMKETLQRQNISPLNDNPLKTLLEEGVDGLHRRFQCAMHLMSNSHQIGVIVHSDYLHLWRSLSAMTGSYGNLYRNQPNYLMTLDLIKGVTLFPANLVRDRITVEARALFKRLKTALLPPQI